MHECHAYTPLHAKLWNFAIVTLQLQYVCDDNKTFVYVYSSQSNKFQSRIGWTRLMIRIWFKDMYKKNLEDAYIVCSHTYYYHMI